MDQHGPAVNAGADLLRKLAFDEVRDTRGELDDFKAPGRLAAGVGEDLAMLRSDELGNLLEALFKDLAEPEQNASSAQGRLC
jgi:hypothetical protein